MCYGSQLTPKPATITRARDKAILEVVQQLPPLFYASAFARPWWPVITAEAPSTVAKHQWGLVPSWAKDPAEFLKKAPTYNAVSATVAEKPSFRGAVRAGHRCLVPATGFYEWHHLGKETYPHFIHLRSRDLFYFAGLYENGTYTILTTEANELMAYVHNAKKRMPVILPREAEDLWLAPVLRAEELQAMCLPYPADDMEAWPVARTLTSRTQDPNTPAAAVLVDYPELHVGPRPPGVVLA
jgi:putative SOS response-associated peptidase YedK